MMKRYFYLNTTNCPFYSTKFCEQWMCLHCFRNVRTQMAETKVVAITPVETTAFIDLEEEKIEKTKMDVYGTLVNCPGIMEPDEPF